ncbi:hypothetical protein ZIOFF_047664 [Zingiber officinale]|uniref:Uncharacterized protein n=1 Tax=Zingiber officinale TaxID=94328 RepID=A0A8J5FRV1_ZINOF|nr:hypothetical protein ZIOFF_047664 [Zingiber officinale]
MADNASETSGISANPMSPSGQIQPVFTMTGTGGSGLQIVSKKLSETNYASWAVAVELYVEGHDKLDILHGTKVKPDEKDPSFRTWRRDNIQLMTWMLNSINSGIKQVILHNKTAYDMWKTLEKMYRRRHDMLRTYQISSQIFKLEQGSMLVTNYFSTLKGLWDEFDYYRMENWSSTDDHQRYLKLLEKDRIIKFLDGLTAEFESLKGQILGLDPTPSLEQVYYKILSEEGRKRTMNNKGISTGGPPIRETSIFIGSANKFWPRGTKRQGDRFCRHCKKTNHDSYFCWKKYPEKKPEKFKHNAKKAPNSSNIAIQKLESFIFGLYSCRFYSISSAHRHKQEPPMDRLVESDALAPDPVKQLSSSVEPTAPLNMNELDLPVAVRKGVRPDITYAVSVVSQYMHAPKTIHMKVVDRILRYLKSCPGKGLLFKGGGDLKGFGVYFVEMYVLCRTQSSRAALCSVVLLFVAEVALVVEKTLLSLLLANKTIPVRSLFEETLHFCNNSAFCKKTFAKKKVFHFCKLSFYSLKKHCILQSFFLSFYKHFISE